MSDTFEHLNIIWQTLSKTERKKVLSEWILLSFNHFLRDYKIINETGEKFINKNFKNNVEWTKFKEKSTDYLLNINFKHFKHYDRNQVLSRFLEWIKVLESIMMNIKNDSSVKDNFINQWSTYNDEFYLTSAQKFFEEAKNKKIKKCLNISVEVKENIQHKVNKKNRI